MMDVLFFEDDIRGSENELFLWQLRRLLREFRGEVVAERVAPRAESFLAGRNFGILILDIMSAVPGNPSIEAVAGLEILRKCRQGGFGVANRGASIFMRTARNEPHIRREAFVEGCDGYYMAGSEDQELLKTIRKVLRK